MKKWYDCFDAENLKIIDLIGLGIVSGLILSSFFAIIFGIVFLLNKLLGW